MDDLLDAVRTRGWARLTWWDGVDIGTVNDSYPELFDGHPLGHEGRTLRPLGNL